MTSSFDLVIANTQAGDHVAVAKHGESSAVEELNFKGTIAGFNKFRDSVNSALTSQTERPSKNALQTFGNALFNTAVTGKIRNLYQHAAGASFSITITSTDPAIKQVPWEYLRDPDPQMSEPPWRDRSIVRVVQTIGKVHSVRRKKGLKVLVLWSQPSEVGPIEWASIENALKTILSNPERISEGVRVRIRSAATITDLTNELSQARYDVIHFCCHGSVQNGEGRIILSDLNGNSAPVPAGTLAALLRGCGASLVFLGACSTSAGSFQPFSVVAESLVEVGIPAVIANQFVVPASTMALLTSSVYNELLLSGNIDSAVAQGRLALLAGVPHSQAQLDWGIPTLYRHVGSSKLFSV